MKIDWWTLGIQTVNVAILVWLLQRFFWRPVAAMIAQRRTAAEAGLADAAAKQAAAKAALAAIDKTRAGFAAEHDGIIADAHKASDAATAARQAAAGTSVAALQASATAAIAAERVAAGAAWTDQASHLAIDIAGRLAARLEGDAVDAAFLGWLQSAVRALPEAARQAAGAAGAMLEATSARPLDAASQDRARASIFAALGASPAISFRTDPALIAGLELSGANLAVANSWRADLVGILAELTRDKR